MLFVGDDWSEAHHDVDIVDDAGSVLAACPRTTSCVGAGTAWCVGRCSASRSCTRLWEGATFESSTAK